MHAHKRTDKRMGEKIGENFCCLEQGIARTQSPSPRNYALESSTFEMIGEVNPPEVQWTGLAPGVPPR